VGKALALKLKKKMGFQPDSQPMGTVREKQARLVSPDNNAFSKNR